MNKIAVTLKAKDLLDLQGILVDGDAEAALKFLETRIAPAIPLRGTADCDSTQRNPYLLKPESPK